MLTQYQTHNSFVDKYSDVCIDGKPCDNLGDNVYFVDGRAVRERDFKEYRKFSPQFRNHLIVENIQKSELPFTGWSASCSKCGTVSINESYWI